MKYIYVDTETGGLNPFLHPLLSIGWFVPDTNLSGTVYLTPEDPSAITPEAAKKNGWPLSMAGKDIPPADALQQFIGVIQAHKPEYLVAHNAPFDYSFLTVALGKYLNSSLPRFLCTMSMAEALRNIGGLPVSSLSLNSILKELDIEHVRSDTHDASQDAMLTHKAHQGIQLRLQKMSELASRLPQPKPQINRKRRYL
jgi:DNA polymerase III epsilon subunit-like protein